MYIRFSKKLRWFALITGVNPDIAMFGKALGNGYAITAVIERQSNE